MAVTAHLDATELRLFLTGILSAKEAERIDQHLQECAACRELLEQARREVGGTAPGPAAGMDETREFPSSDRLKKEEAQFELASGVGIEATKKSASLAGAVSGFSFLSPPSQPGELGWLAGYRVVRLIGSGGMGVVFEAEDVGLKRRVAIKVMKPELAAESKARERFLQEARTSASVPHDNIVTIFQVGQHNDIPFLAMQYLEGESLEQRLEREGKLPLADVLRIGRETAEGLAAAHARGLIHRDIKPGNIWLEADGPGQPFKRVRILDFGLARLVAGRSNLTGTGLVVGTPGFLAPEQAKGMTLDHRCDLFSLGCVLYCMITGEEPFGGIDVLAVLSALASEDPRPVEEFDQKIPAALADLVHELLAKKPEERPESAREVADRLLAIAEEQGLSICPLGSGERQPPSSISRTVSNRRRPSAALRMDRRRQLAILGGAGLVLLLGGGLFWLNRRPAGGPAPGEPIKVGVLHSLRGTMSESEQAVQEATLLAIDEINRQGGVLGRPIQPVVADGQSREEIFAQEAERLIEQEKVSTIFGCWTSASRKAVKPIVEKNGNLLIYPVQYEGLEQSPNIVYLGAAPNQQILPAIDFAVKALGKRRLFLVGSDYVFPRAAHAIIRDHLKQSPGVQIVGEEYIPLGATDVKRVIDAIAQAKPDLILNTLNGSSNIPFFRELRDEGITPDQTPTISFSIAENELRSLDIKDLKGDYAAWNYFMSIDRPENRAFIQQFRARYGPQRVLSDPMEAAYSGVHLWAQAVNQAQSTHPAAIREALKGQSFAAPHGRVKIDPANLHTWKPFRVGKIQPSGQFEIVYTLESPIEPKPYPASRTPTEWQLFLEKLYQGWGNRWEAPRR